MRHPTSRKWLPLLVIAGAALIASVLPIAPAVAAPTVELLNPSNYSSPGPLVLSNKHDADNTYHLVGWVGEVPSNPLVEFELADATGTIATATGNRVGNDMWEADLTIPETTLDGTQYILRAILYTGFTGPDTGTEVGRTQEIVTVNNSDVPPPQQAETVEMTYPSNGGGLGFVTPLGKATNTALRGTASVGVQQVRALYTKSAPGTDPVWTQCGSGTVGTESAFRARCTLNEGDSPNQVTAVAVTANRTPPPAPPNAPADDSGDAHRVVPYIQVPTSIEFDPEAVRVEPRTCRPMTFQILDQNSQPVVGINVDVHAQGPDDQLRFATSRNVNSPFQAPDKGHLGTEPTVKCIQADDQQTQGEHNVAGGPDFKHIESTTGTNTAGQFTAVLRSDSKGGTQMVAWADVDDDDSQGAVEASGRARIGWGQAPPEPEEEVFIDPATDTAQVGSCERFVAVAQRGNDRLSGRNLDVHISGPAGVAFCNPGDGTTQSPNSGSHTGDADTGQNNTFHNEGTTDSNGQIVFGVTSSGSGKTDLFAWLDGDDNDEKDGGEKSGVGQVTWQEEGERSISIQSSRSSVKKGKKVRLFGSIEADQECSAGQTVNVQAKSKGQSFHNVKSDTTNDNGTYSVKVKVKKTTKFRAIAPANGACEQARSNKTKVKAHR